MKGDTSSKNISLAGLHDHPESKQNRFSLVVGWCLALLICLWIAWCTALGPLYRHEGSMSEFTWSNALIFLATLTACLSLVTLVRHLILGGHLPHGILSSFQNFSGIGTGIGKSETSIPPASRNISGTLLQTFRSFILRQTRGWKPIMRFLVLGWSWVLLTLLAAYGADLYAQIKECTNWLMQIQGNTPPYGGNAFTQMDVYPIGHYLWPHNPTFLTDQHNLILTFFYGMTAIASKEVTGSYDAGIVLLAALQLIFGAFCCAVTADRFFKGGSPHQQVQDSLVTGSGAGAYRAGPLARTLVMLFFLICPFIVFSTISLTKSPLFAFAFVWWFGIWYQVVVEQKSGHNPFQNHRLLVGLALSTTLMLISTKYGIYIIAAQIILALILYRRYWRVYLVCLLLPALAFTGLIRGLEASGRIIRGDPIESKSIQLQQIARVAKVSPESIDPQIRKELEPIMDLDSAALQYTPWEADRVKSSGNQPKVIVYRWRTVTASQMKQFNHAWLSLGRDHILPYMDAFMAESYGYFDPFDRAYVPMSYYVNNSYVQDSSTWIQYWCHSWRNTIADLARSWASIPLLGWVAQSNFWVTLCLLLIAAWISAGRWDNLLTFFPLLLIMGVMVTAPANNFERHMLPVAMIVPLILLAMVREGHNNSQWRESEPPVMLTSEKHHPSIQMFCLPSQSSDL